MPGKKKFWVIKKNKIKIDGIKGLYCHHNNMLIGKIKLKKL